MTKIDLTAHQAHVLDNIERVAILPYERKTRLRKQRFQLDGRECTLQINSLLQRKMIRVDVPRPFARTGIAVGDIKRRMPCASEVDRQGYSARAVYDLRAALMSPVPARRDT